MVKIYCEPCRYKGDGVVLDNGDVICPVCGEVCYDSVSPEEFDEIF